MRDALVKPATNAQQQAELSAADAERELRRTVLEVERRIEEAAKARRVA